MDALLTDLIALVNDREEQVEEARAQASEKKERLERDAITLRTAAMNSLGKRKKSDASTTPVSAKKRSVNAMIDIVLEVCPITSLNIIP